MKITKHIEKLAKEQFKFESKKYHWMQTEDDYVPDNAKRLNEVKEALIKGRFYIRVDKVSSSGMSRTVSMAYIKDNKLHHITDEFTLKLAGCDKNGRVSGCGMDMMFHCQYTLFQNLHSSYKQAHYQKRMARYNDL